MGKCEFDEIEALVNKAISAQNREIANEFINKLDLMKRTLNLQPYTTIVFCELLSSVKAASGQVKEKERKLYTVNQCLNKLKPLIEEQEEQ